MTEVIENSGHTVTPHPRPKNIMNNTIISMSEYLILKLIIYMHTRVHVCIPSLRKIL